MGTENQLNMRLIAPIVALLILTGCSAPPIGVWQEFCVQAGKHDFKPSPLTIDKRPNIAYQWKFTPSMQYDLGGPDQCDWNKLHGVAWHVFNNHEDAFMVAWRWNLDGYWQVAAYYHDEGETGWAGAPCNYASSLETNPDIPVAIVYPSPDGNGYFSTHIDLQPNGHAAITILADEIAFYEHYFGIETDDRYREVGPWFGGNQPAPHAMCMMRKRMN